MRKRQRTTTRGVSREVLDMAAVEVLDKGQSVRAVSRTFKICHVTLQRFLKKVRKLRETGSTDTSSIQVGYRSHKQVFQPEQEAELLAYLKEMSGMNSGLSSTEVRTLAFQMAKHNQLKYPDAWNVKEMAGKDWYTSFMKRNPMFSVKRPRPSEASRTPGFSRENVSNFFQNLGAVLQREGLEAKDVWNVSETGITAGKAPEETAAAGGSEQVGAVASGARGALVTMAVAVNALGNSIPPYLVFPTGCYFRHYIRDAPTGSIGSANGSGHMQEAEFLIFLQHFVKHTRASVNGKVLLLLDKHSTPMSAEAIDYCDANGVILLTFPPQCSHKLQPLVRNVFGPFKRNLTVAMDCWMKTHPGTQANVYDVPGLIAEALLISATPRNITSGFRCTGIWPFNSNVFDDDDFAPSSVAGWPDLAAEITTPDSAADLGASDPAAASETEPPSLPSSSTGASSSADFHPSPKSEPRKSCRKRRIPACLSDSPVDCALEEEAETEKRVKPKVKRGVEVKREGKETDLKTDGDSPCLFCDDYYLTTIV